METLIAPPPLSNQNIFHLLSSLICPSLPVIQKSLVKNFKRQIPVFFLGHSIIASTMDSKSKRTDLHEASFSSYLTKGEENLVLKLTESVQLPHAAALFSSQGASVPVGSERTKAVDGEIKVFDAEKYFNMKLNDHENPRIIDTIAGNHGQELENQVDLHQIGSKSKIGTPSVSSEVSWNSQTVLLPSSIRNSSQNRHQKVNERWFFPGFACNGSCSDKKSVFVDDNVANRGLHGREFRKEPFHVAQKPVMLQGRKQSQSKFQAIKEDFRSTSFERMSMSSSRREEYHMLPTVNSGVVQGLKVVQRGEQKILPVDPRKSLEVFGSHMTKKEDIAMNLERKLSVLTWDAIPKAPTRPTTSTSSQVYEDIESDASSDLFEIENISSNAQPMFTKQTSDGMSGCMTPTSRYEPSQTSIEWSVVTASAADFSAASDYDAKMVAENSANSGLTSTPKKNSPNGLLGCKSLKAVDVAETACKRNEKAKPHMRKHQRPDAPEPVRKLQVDTMVKDCDFL